MNENRACVWNCGTATEEVRILGADTSVAEVVDENAACPSPLLGSALQIQHRSTRDGLLGKLSLDWSSVWRRATDYQSCAMVSASFGLAKGRRSTENPQTEVERRSSWGRKIQVD